MTRLIHRRQFVRTSLALAGASAPLFLASRVWGANERLNIGAIGVGGRGAGDLQAVSGENIVALCDVDEGRLNQAAASHPGAKKYFDYRELLEQKDLDAVVVATPDHHHAPATMRALRRGLHVYCEKPLTHTVAEARLIAKTAAAAKVATQMGTQNHEHPGYRRLVELVQGGAIGAVREVHVITDRPGQFWKQGLAKPSDKPPVPAGLKWDLWLGPASQRPYHPEYVPFRWRGWWDFGCGAIGDMAIHLMDPAFWALNLGGPVKVTSTGPPPQAESGPTWMITRFQFGQRGDLPPVDVYWYEGETKPKPEIAQDLPMNGSLFIGDEGRIKIRHGGGYPWPTDPKSRDFPQLLPADKFADYEGPKPSLADTPGHHQQWIQACKTGSRTGSNFQYAGPFTEIVLLGNIAFRAGTTIEFDPGEMKITNAPQANQLLSKSYRKGWEL